MGLGKTIQAIGLILANPPAGHDYDAPKSAKPAARKFPSKSSLKKLEVPVLQRVLDDAHVNPVPSTKGAMVDACLNGFKNGAISLDQYCRSTEAPKTTLIVCPVSVRMFVPVSARGWNMNSFSSLCFVGNGQLVRANQISCSR